MYQTFVVVTGYITFIMVIMLYKENCLNTMPQRLFSLYRNDVCIFNFSCCHMLPSPICLCIILDSFFFLLSKSPLKVAKALETVKFLQIRIKKLLFYDLVFSCDTNVRDSLHFTCISHSQINFGECHHTRHNPLPPWMKYNELQV